MLNFNTRFFIPFKSAPPRATWDPFRAGGWLLRSDDLWKSVVATTTLILFCCESWVILMVWLSIGSINLAHVLYIYLGQDSEMKRKHQVNRSGGPCTRLHQILTESVLFMGNFWPRWMRFLNFGRILSSESSLEWWPNQEAPLKTLHWNPWKGRIFRWSTLSLRRSIHTFSKRIAVSMMQILSTYTSFVQSWYIKYIQQKSPQFKDSLVLFLKNQICWTAEFPELTPSLRIPRSLDPCCGSQKRSKPCPSWEWTHKMHLTMASCPF